MRPYSLLFNQLLITGLSNQKIFVKESGVGLAICQMGEGRKGQREKGKEIRI